MAWVPRRAGDRGALETGCLPILLPGGRPVADPQARVDAATAWGVDSLPETPAATATRSSPPSAPASSPAWSSVGSTPPTRPTRPRPPRPSTRAQFVVALDLRASDVTRAADVVFPVAPVVDKAGTFVTWEGRPRPFEAVLGNPSSLPDLRVLAGIAEELGAPLGFRTVAEVWASSRTSAPGTARAPR